MRRIVALAALCAAVLLNPAVAHAHADLVESNPREGQRLDALPATVELTLNENVSEPAYLVVTAPDGTRLEGDVNVSGRTVTTSVAPSDNAGAFTIAYRLVSADAHAVNGTYQFEVAGPASSAPSDAASPSPGSSEEPIAAAPVAESGSNTTAALVVIGFFVVALALMFSLIRAGMRSEGGLDDD